jgi:hypothetical protein
MSPDSGSVDARPDTISILFSKKMDRSSVRDWLFVTPPVAVAEKRWRGDRYDLVLDSPPDSGKTYTILLGAEVIDRRRNPLGPWTSSFSTGGRVDDGTVGGVVRSGVLKAAGAYVYAWPWADSMPAMDGEIPSPLRMGQCAKDGKFSLPFLPRNLPLRICALHDSHADRSFDAEDDTWGCVEGPVTLNDTTRVLADLEIYLVLPDEPGTLKGSAVDSSCVGRGAERLRGLRLEADSLTTLLGGRAAGDSLAPDTLVGFAGVQRPAVDSTMVRNRLAEIDSLRILARDDSARCAVPVIVRLFEQDTTLVSEARGDGTFEFGGVAPGVYRIRAFRDADGDGEPGGGEKSGEYPFPVELAPGRTMADLKFPLRTLP